MPTCEVPFCKKDAKYMVQSIKEKLFTCAVHLAQTVDNATGKEFYIIKVEDLDP